MSKLTLIVPCYNEAENVVPFHEAALKAFEGSGIELEIVYIDDGSKDATLHNLKKIYAQHDCAVKIVSFSRNFGKESGIYAGLEHATGDYMCIIDADLQQQPSTALEMVRILEADSDVDVVAAYQEKRIENRVLTFFKTCFYKVINKLSEVPLQNDASDFRTFRRSVRDSVLSLCEYHRFSKGIFAWVGYNTRYIPYTADERLYGTSKWSFWKLCSYALEGIVGFSTAPLRLATIFGCITGVFAILYGALVVLVKLFKRVEIPAYATIIILQMVFSSIQLFCIGIIGEYIGRNFEQGKRRPIYIAKEIVGEE